MPQPPVASVAASKQRRKPGPPLRHDWQARFLARLRDHGTYAQSCLVVGVSDETVRRYRLADPAFDQACKDARTICAERLEEAMVAQAKKTGNPVGYIVRLKALKPEEYIEKHVIANLNVNLDPSSDPQHVSDGLRVLAAMFGAADPELKAQVLALTAGTNTTGSQVPGTATFDT